MIQRILLHEEHKIDITYDGINLRISFESSSIQFKISYSISHSSKLEMNNFHFTKGQSLLSLPLYSHFSQENFTTYENILNSFIKEKCGTSILLTSSIQKPDILAQV